MRCRVFWLAGQGICDYEAYPEGIRVISQPYQDEFQAMSV